MAGRGYDVIVVGTGAMGGSITSHLARRGVRVLGLDRYEPPHAFGSSHGRTRVIREAYFEDPVYVPLVQRSMQLWRELEAATGQSLLHVTGAVMLGAADSAAVQGSLRSAAEHGIPHERLSGAEVRHRFPALRADDGSVGVWEPGAGALAVEAGVVAHLEAARAYGAELRTDQPMLRWRGSPAGVEVDTPDGRLHAGALVLAAGAWMGELVPQLPLRVTRQVQLWFRAAGDPAYVRPDRCPIFLWELPSGELFYGLPDFGDGLKAARHHGGEPTTPDGVRREATSEDVEAVRRFLAQHIPSGNGELAEARVCLYTNTPSGHFLLDRHPEHRSVWLVSPCSGHGFKFAPAIGEGVATWIVSGVPPPGFERFRLGASDG